MTKTEFLTELEKLLSGLPSEDIQNSLDYYAEIIDDGIEDGLLEEDAVKAIGIPQEVVKHILMDVPISKLVKQKIKPKRELHGWEIALIILGAPLWLPLVIALIAVILSVYVVLWSIIISLYAAAVSVAACSVVGIGWFGVYAISGRLTEGIFMLGAGLLCIGLAILMFVVFNQVTKGLIWLSKKIWLGIKSCFVKGEA